MADGAAVGGQSNPDGADFDRIASYYEAVVGDCLTSESPADLHNAVARFTAPVDSAFLESADPEEAVETVLWAAWTAVVQAAEACAGPVQVRLVDLVRKVEEHELPRRSDGLPDCRIWGLRVYGDLPVFGAQMREEWDVAWSGAAGPDGWVNLNAFAARLTAAAIDFCLYALWTIRDCLEEEEEEQGSHSFAAVAEWFTICGPLLATRAARGHAPQEWGASARVGRLCAEQGVTKGGFTVQRWEFWRSRLKTLSRQAAGAQAALTAFELAAVQGR